MPNELPIHGEILKKRPAVGCVIHTHPKEALICGITGLPFRPIFGAYNNPAMRMSLAPAEHPFAWWPGARLFLPTGPYTLIKG